MKEIDQKLEIPKKERETSISVHEAEFIYNFLQDKEVSSTLEIGLAFGYSTAYIISATKSSHIAIDPFQTEYWQNLGRQNISKLGFDSLLEVREDYSHSALPQLLQEKKLFDFVFIDGGHKFDEIFIDWYYSDLLLNQNGYILFHDSWMRSTQMVASFIRRNRTDYIEIAIPIKNLILFHKIGKDNRPWYHFKSFCTFKGIIKHAFFNFKMSFRNKSN